MQKKDGSKLNVGIQTIDGYYVSTKMLLYYAQIHSHQDEYEYYDGEIIKTITINILDFEYLEGEEYHQVVNAIESKTGKKINAFERHVLELPKYKKEEIKTQEDAWVAYLQGRDEEKIKKAKEKNQKIKKLDEVLEQYWINETMG